MDWNLGTVKNIVDCPQYETNVFCEKPNEMKE